MQKSLVMRDFPDKYFVLFGLMSYIMTHVLGSFLSTFFRRSLQKILPLTSEATVWSNYSDLTRPHPKWWFSKGNPLISGKSRLVKYYNLARTVQTLNCPQGFGLERNV